MRIQLWSYNYDPEPTGIAPLSAVWARTMTERGHDVSVVAAHPHYPEPRWGTRLTPYREVRDGVPVLRLPLWSGRASTLARLRQEASFSAALTAAVPFLGSPEVIVAVSPSFPALLPAMAAARVRRVPWVLWLQDILPDGAAATGLLDEGPLLEAARRFERAAYASAARVVVISDSFAANLRGKGVSEGKLARIFNPASRPVLDAPGAEPAHGPPVVLNMGNIGYTQNLRAIVEAFEASEELAQLGARLVVAGDGVAGEGVRAAIRSDRAEVLGVVDDAELERRLRAARVALVSQQYQGLDFNVPSKLMNYMGHGLPVMAAARDDSEVARIVRESGGGWVTTSPNECAKKLAQVLGDGARAERRVRGEAGLRYARRHFTPERSAQSFEAVLEDLP